MSKWRFEHGNDAFVFYHPALDMFMHFDDKFSYSFEYQLGKNMKFREVQSLDLQSRNVSFSQYSVGYGLLSKLRSGQGSTVDGIHSFGVWSFDIDRSTIAFTIKDKPADQLFLTNDGFIFICPDGALVAGHEYETCTTAAQAQAALDKARASEDCPTQLPRPKFKVIVLSLAFTYDGRHVTCICDNWAGHFGAA